MDRLLMNDQWDVQQIITTVRSLMHTDEVLAQGGLFAEMRAKGDIQAAKAAIPTALVDHASAIGPLPVVREKLRQFADCGATHLFVDRRGLPDDSDAVGELLSQLQGGSPG
jgi:hypothetical protein